MNISSFPLQSPFSFIPPFPPGAQPLHWTSASILSIYQVLFASRHLSGYYTDHFYFPNHIIMHYYSTVRRRMHRADHLGREVWVLGPLLVFWESRFQKVKFQLHLFLQPTRSEICVFIINICSTCIRALLVAQCTAKLCMRSYVIF